MRREAIGTATVAGFEFVSGGLVRLTDRPFTGSI